MTQIRRASAICQIESQPSLRDLRLSTCDPALETPGLSLRDSKYDRGHAANGAA